MEDTDTELLSLPQPLPLPQLLTPLPQSLPTPLPQPLPTPLPQPLPLPQLLTEVLTPLPQPSPLPQLPTLVLVLPTVLPGGNFFNPTNLGNLSIIINIHKNVFNCAKNRT